MGQKKLSRKRAAPSYRRKKARVALCRRRGKPFSLGNSAGLATRFKPGECGRSRAKKTDAANPPDGKITQALRRMVALPVDQRILVRTHAERIALVLITEAEQKKLGAIAEVVDRCEGRAHVSMSIENQANPIIDLIKSTDALSARLGPPEQPTEIPEEPPKQLPEARKLLPEPEADDEAETLSEDAPVVWAIRPIEEN